MMPLRTWSNTAADDGSIHCLGNGRLCAYEQGPNIIQVFGPPYSSPVLGKVMFEPEGPVVVESRREACTAIWTHTVMSGGALLAEMTDFVAAELPCLVRHIRATAALRLRLELNPACSVTANDRLLGSEFAGLLCEIAPGAFFYANYPYPRPVYYQIAWQGAITPLPDHTGWLCGPGEGWLYFIGGPEYPQTMTHCEAALTTGCEPLLEQSRRSWQQFTGSRPDWTELIPAAMPLRAPILQALDDVCVLIKAQQSIEGGVLAGHNYHLCYVRDQYGVSRGLLAAGHIAEAKAILEYYWGVWQHHGKIHNAQAAGVDGVFHIHENDEVEITGYLIRQVFDLLEKSGDHDFVAEIWPMLEWAWEAQKRHLIAGMLPFNGDETYVAGGILPRTTLNDGSAEATLLFIDSGAKLLTWAGQNHRWSGEKIAAERTLLAGVRSQYRTNFWDDGQIITNNPLRADLPGGSRRHRHGVCERCAAEGRFRYIGWTERSAAGRYLCPRCLAENDYLPGEPHTYHLQSVSLTPFYFHSDLFDKTELRSSVEAILHAYHQTGQLPSRPADERGISVGYDFGFLLYALVELNHPAALELAEKTLSLLDSTGAWVEYYRHGQPSGTRCRPWESAINLSALLRLVER